MDKALIKYTTLLKKLNRGYTKGLGRAPHKPILLLAIIQLIHNKSITSNKIYITPDLVLTFKNLWKLLVDSNHTPNFALPFFHMRSEPFWYLVKKPGYEIQVTKSKSIKSFKNLNESVAYAQIDKGLFELLNNMEESNILLQFLLAEYFNNTQLNYNPNYINPEVEKIEYQILNEPKSNYQDQIKELQLSLDDDDFQEEIFIRGGLFKKTVPKIYDYTCCISGMKIESISNAQMIDACHIVPFSVSNDDTIPNGISLSPNLHRAFDRGLVTVNQDFIVRISPTVTDNDSVYSIAQFEGKQILLPENNKWFPSTEALVWHNKEVFLI